MNWSKLHKNLTLLLGVEVMLEAHQGTPYAYCVCF